MSLLCVGIAYRQSLRLIRGQSQLSAIATSIMVAGSVVMVLGVIANTTFAALLWVPYCLIVLGQAISYPISLSTASAHSPVKGALFNGVVRINSSTGSCFRWSYRQPAQCSKSTLSGHSLPTNDGFGARVEHHPTKLMSAMLFS